MPQTYTLPTATTATLGGVKVDGETITIEDGVISAANNNSGSGSNSIKVILPSPYNIDTTNISNEAKEVLFSVMKEEIAPDLCYFVFESYYYGTGIGHISRI